MAVSLGKYELTGYCITVPGLHIRRLSDSLRLKEERGWSGGMMECVLLFFSVCYVDLSIFFLCTLQLLLNIKAFANSHFQKSLCGSTYYFVMYMKSESSLFTLCSSS